MSRVAEIGSAWAPVCHIDDLLPGSGAAALVEGRSLAIFRLDDNRLFAIGNVDPFSGAAVLSRGIVGDVDGEPVVASPIFKQHFRLANGGCVESATVSVPSYPVDLADGTVVVRVPASR